MFLGIAIYETLSKSGELTTYIIKPSDSSQSLIVDNLKDLNHNQLENNIDVGPLRFYAKGKGLRLECLTSSLGGNAFENVNGNIEFNLQHSHVPLKQNHAGFYGLLLPENYSGNVDLYIEVGNDEQSKYAEKVFLQDTGQIFISSDFRVYADQYSTPKIKVSASLTEGNYENYFKIANFKDYFGNIPGLYHSSVSNLIQEINRNMPENKPQVFICHSSEDKRYARRLATILASNGVKVWIDEAEIKIGDSLIEKLENGILSSNNLIIVLTPQSVNSKWCKEELRMALAMQIGGEKLKVLPSLFEDCEIPGFLREKTYADFRIDSNFNNQVSQLLRAIG